MIETEHGICYSPVPPSGYVKVIDGVARGIAKFYDEPGQLQLWNLMWLSMPELDRYLDFGDDLAKWESMTRSIDTFLMGLLLRVLTARDDLDDFGEPPLAELLKLPPMDFVHELRRRNYQDLSIYIEYGEKWMATMLERAQCPHGAMKHVDGVVILPMAGSNIVKVDFKK